MFASNQGIGLGTAISDHNSSFLREGKCHICPVIRIGISFQFSKGIIQSRFLTSGDHISLIIKSILGPVNDSGHRSYHMTAFIHVFPTTVFLYPDAALNISISIQMIGKPIFILFPAACCHLTICLFILPVLPIFIPAFYTCIRL